jgi:FKBP-type peptidyl-prolyl cis-trans isomerase
MSRAFFLITLVIAMILSLQTNAISMKKILLKSTAAMSSLGLLVNAAYADMTVAPFDDKIRYEVVTAGQGDMPKVGDLVSIRFKASYKGKDFDNTFETPQPYMFRAG